MADAMTLKETMPGSAYWWRDVANARSTSLADSIHCWAKAFECMQSERDAAVIRANEVQQRLHVREMAATIERLEQRIRELEAGLRAIQQWDCLNPPREDLLADLPWLRRTVDELLVLPEPNQ